MDVSRKRKRDRRVQARLSEIGVLGVHAKDPGLPIDETRLDVNTPLAQLLPRPENRHELVRDRLAFSRTDAQTGFSFGNPGIHEPERSVVRAALARKDEVHVSVAVAVHRDGPDPKTNRQIIDQARIVVEHPDRADLERFRQVPLDRRIGEKELGPGPAVLGDRDVFALFQGARVGLHRRFAAVGVVVGVFAAQDPRKGEFEVVPGSQDGKNRDVGFGGHFDGPGLTAAEFGEVNAVEFLRNVLPDVRPV